MKKSKWLISLLLLAQIATSIPPSISASESDSSLTSGNSQTEENPISAMRADQIARDLFRNLITTDNGLTTENVQNQSSITQFWDFLQGNDTETTESLDVKVSLTHRNIQGQVKWDTQDSKYSYQPETVWIDLMRATSGSNQLEVVDSLEITKKNDWKYVFENMPINDDKGAPYVYSVVARPSEGYISYYDITNVFNTIDLGFDVLWNDYDNQFATRPEAIEIEILQNNKVLETHQMTVKDVNTDTFAVKDLPIYDPKGNRYEYTARGKPVGDYDIETRNNSVIYNYVNLEMITYSGNVNWEDYDNKFSTRPQSTIVHLFKNGVKEKSMIIKSNDKGEWVFSFDKLLKYDPNGNEYRYSIQTEGIDKYQTIVEENGILHRYVNDEMVPMLVSIEWNDYNNEFATRPRQVNVTLLQNGKEIMHREVFADNQGLWRTNFGEYPKYDSEGNEYQYTVETPGVEQYTTNIYRLIIRNNLTNKDVSDIKGTISWKDYDNQFNNRPNSVEVVLMRNDQEIDRMTVSANEEDVWSYDFGRLDNFDEEGNPYRYFLMIDNKGNYRSILDEFDLINIHQNVEVTSIEGQIQWIENNEEDETKRPDSVKVKLLQNDVELYEQEVKPNINGDWLYHFNHLMVYDDVRSEYVYSVEQVALQNYLTSYSDGNIINELEGIDVTSVSGDILWEDQDNADDSRPDFVTVNLLRNDEVVRTVTIRPDEANNWHYSFTGILRYDPSDVEYTYTTQLAAIPGYQTSVTEDGNLVNVLDSNSSNLVIGDDSTLENEILAGEFETENADEKTEEQNRNPLSTTAWIWLVGGGILILGALYYFIKKR